MYYVSNYRSLNMISKKFIYLLVLTLSIILLQQNISFAKDGVKNKNNYVNKNLDQLATSLLDINLISTIFYNNGIGDISPLGTSGLFYPQGSGKTAVFTSGLLWGGQITGEAIPRVGGTAFRTGLKPGAILSNGQADDRSEEHTSELQSRQYLVCSLLL